MSGAAPDPAAPGDRRRVTRYALDGAVVALRGEVRPLLDLSTLGLRAAGPHPSLHTGDVVPVTLLIPRDAPARPPRRFGLLAMVLTNDARGLTLRLIQPSRLWASKIEAYLASHAHAPERTGAAARTAP